MSTESGEPGSEFDIAIGELTEMVEVLGFSETPEMAATRGQIVAGFLAGEEPIVLTEANPVGNRMSELLADYERMGNQRADTLYSEPEGETSEERQARTLRYRDIQIGSAVQRALLYFQGGRTPDFLAKLDDAYDQADQYDDDEAAKYLFYKLQQLKR